MSRISATFKRLRWEKEAALIPYLMVGYPTLDVTRQLVPLMARQGADLIMLGVPSSDSLDDCLSVATDARRANEVPLVLVSLYKHLHQYGLEFVAADFAAVGLDGLVVPDLPLNEAGALRDTCAGAGVDLVFSATPTSTDEEIRRVAEMASGFIYCASPPGKTTTPPAIEHENNGFLTHVRRYSNLPLAVEAGSSTPEQVAQVIREADGVVVMSALTKLIESLPEEEVLYSVGEFIREMKVATVRLGET